VATKLVIGNWKMNGSLALNRALLEAISGEICCSGVVVCPPAPYLLQAMQLLTGSHVLVGAQNVCCYQDGAYTGEVSATMLSDLGCQYVLVGHSERRALFGESDAEVAAKAVRVAEAGLCPVICVGESLSQREQGIAERVVAAQLMPVLAELKPGLLHRCVIAYEPVWAIGSGLVATTDDIEKMHGAIKQVVHRDAACNLPVLYGGSVKADNAGTVLAVKDVDGVLVGGASLSVESFLTICKVAQQCA